MDGVFSPEKNDAKISHFGQAVLILEQVIPDHVRFKIFTRKLKLCLKTRQTRLILFSNSEPPRLRDVVSHLITIETTINTHTHTHTHTRTHTHIHTHV